MKAVVLQERTVIAGRQREKGEVVWVDDAFVQGQPPVYLTDDQITQATFEGLIDNFAADLAARKITVTALGKGLYQVVEWGTDAEGDAVAVRSLNIKRKTLVAAKQNVQNEKQAVAAKYTAQIDQLTALITACGG